MDTPAVPWAIRKLDQSVGANIPINALISHLSKPAAIDRLHLFRMPAAQHN